MPIAYVEIKRGPNEPTSGTLRRFTKKFRSQESFLKNVANDMLPECFRRSKLRKQNFLRSAEQRRTTD